MPIQVTESRGNVLEMEARGKLTSSDLHGMEDTFQTLVHKHGKIRVLFIMRDFHGWEPAAFRDEVKCDVKHLSEIERLAMVGDKQWEKFLAVFSRPFTSAEIRYFDESALPAARAWL